LHILFATSEAVPFAKTGGLADVAGALPEALARRGHRVTRVMPLYAAVDRRIHGLKAAGRRVTVPIGGRDVTANVLVSRGTGVDTYFLDHPAYYDRPGIYGEKGQDYPDNLERFALLSRGTLALCARLEIAPDVIHCNDWQTALIPVYLKRMPEAFRGLARSASVLTIHNLAFQGLFPMAAGAALDLPDAALGTGGLEFYGRINLLKGGLVHADALTTVSHTYAQEIQDARAGFGLEGVLADRKARLIGIVNGLDTGYWDPSHDPFLKAAYSRQRPAGRALNRPALCRDLGLTATGPGPVIGMVGRLTDQKGVTLVLEALDALVALGARLAVLGDGDPAIVAAFKAAQERHPGRVGIRAGYDEALSHRIYAGSDLFLMPSRFEPCGLSQLIAMRYGAPPVVRRVGGLADTVVPYEERPDSATGFGFEPFTAEALLACLRGAMEVFGDPERFKEVQRRGMALDPSWDAHTGEYEDVYRKAMTWARGKPMGVSSMGAG
jgi:starch synthase